jgi:hypothetical protein
MRIVLVCLTVISLLAVALMPASIVSAQSEPVLGGTPWQLGCVCKL